MHHINQLPGSLSTHGVALVHLPSLSHPEHQQQLAAQVHPLAASQLHIIILNCVAVCQHTTLQINLWSQRKE